MATQNTRAIAELVEALEIQFQGFRLSGAVTPETPGGQLTAVLRDGTPVDRWKHAQKVLAKYGGPPKDGGMTW